MSTNVLLAPAVNHQHDEDILKMMDVGEFAELHDFLGEILHPEISPDLSSSMTALATTADSHYPLQYQQQQHIEGSVPSISPLAPSTSIVSATIQPLHNTLQPISEPSIRVSPAPSIASAGDTSGDDSSTGAEDGIPHTVTTGPFSYDETFQDAHQRNQQAATSPDDVVANKKIRRRERNREHAKKCRSRKKSYLKSLEDSVLDLKQENDKLLRMVLTKFTKEEISNIVKGPVDQLPIALKKLNCKAATKSAETYLQSLRDECKL